MSLILDALNRAERDRNQAPEASATETDFARDTLAALSVPASATPQVQVPEGRLRSHTGLPWGGFSWGGFPWVGLAGLVVALLLATLFVVGMGSGWLTRDTQDIPVQPEAERSVASVSAVAQLIRAKDQDLTPAKNPEDVAGSDKAPRTQQPAGVPAPAAQDIAALYAPENPADDIATADAKAKVATTKEMTAKDAAARKAAALYQERQANRAPATDAAALAPASLTKTPIESQAQSHAQSVSLPPLQTPVAAVQMDAVQVDAAHPEAAPPEDATALDPQGLGLLAARAEILWFNDLSWQTRLTIPSINYAQHLADASLRQVTINGVAAKAGQQAGEFRVLEILADGVILEYKTTRFKLAALNGWINI